MKGTASQEKWEPDPSNRSLNITPKLQAETRVSCAGVHRYMKAYKQMCLMKSCTRLYGGSTIVMKTVRNSMR